MEDQGNVVPFRLVKSTFLLSIRITTETQEVGTGTLFPGPKCTADEWNNSACPLLQGQGHFTVLPICIKLECKFAKLKQILHRRSCSIATQIQKLKGERERERQEILKWSLIKSSHYRKGGLISQANTGIISKRVLSV